MSSRVLLSLPSIAVALGVAGVLGCNVEAQQAPADCHVPAGAPAQRGLLVVDSDFASTNVGVIGWAGAPTSSLLSSASGGTGLSAGLSGDVVVPRVVPPSGEVVLIDRGNGVLTWVASGTCGVRAQLSLGAFRSDPHDYVETAGKAYVTRYGQNPDPSAALLDRGGDVLVLDPISAQVLKPISLHAWVPIDLEGAQPTPDHLLLWHGFVLVILQGFNATLDAATDATIAVIDPSIDEVVATTTLPGLKDCNGIEALDADRVAVVCSGVFKSFGSAPPISPAEGAAASGIAVLAPGTDGGLSVERVIGAPALIGQPLGFSFGVIDPTHVLVSAFGDFDVGQTDAVFEVDLAAESPLVGTPIRSASAFDFGDIVCLDGEGCVLADAEAHTGKGALRRFRQGASGMEETSRLPYVDAFGLPPRNLGRL